MDLKILEIASNTENHKVVKNNIIEDMGYQCRSCVYCQASVSLLSRWVIQSPIEKISEFVSNAEFFFDKNFDQSKKINIKDLKDFKKIMNPKNISRKECLLLPFKTLSKALNL